MDSIENQSFSNYEVIIVNDNSTDNSELIVNSFTHANKLFRKISNEQNIGAGGSRNRGLKESMGNYLLFLDSDDQLANNLVLERIFDELHEEPDVLLFNYNNLIQDSGIIEESDRVREVSFWENIPVSTAQTGTLADFKEQLLFPAYPWNKVFNKAFIKRKSLQFSEIHCHNDIYFVWTALLYSNSIRCFNMTAVLYLHHTGENRITNNGSIKRFDFFKAVDAVHNEIADLKPSNDIKVLFEIFKFHVFSWGSRHLKRKYLWPFIKRYLERSDKTFYKKNKVLFNIFFTRKTEARLFEMTIHFPVAYWVLLIMYPLYHKFVHSLFRAKNGS